MTLAALLFDLDDTLALTPHFDVFRRTRNRTGVQAQLPDLRPPDGLAEVLAEVAARLPLGIVTTSPRWYADLLLAHLFPQIRWHTVVTYEDVQKRKPHPEALLLAAKQLGLQGSEGRIMYVGDRDQDLEAARRAGMQGARASWCGGEPQAGDVVLGTPQALLNVGLPNVPVTVREATRTLLALQALPKVGRKTLLDVAQGGSDLLAAALQQRRIQAVWSDGAWEAAQDTAAAQIAWAKRLGVRILSVVDPDYPPLLRAMNREQPAVLFVRGQVPGDRALCVVGTREPTAHGLETARRMAGHFAARGFNIVSGLALGVDAAAHLAALEVGGQTTAVLAHGLQTVAPRQHALLAERIVAQGGGLISEYPCGVDARPAFFVDRDRVQAGLALGTLLVQTDRQGGSWHAARASLRLGRSLAYPVPTQTDRNRGEAKIQGLLALEGSEAERQSLLQTNEPPRLFPVRGKQDYAELERRLTMQLGPDGASPRSPDPEPLLTAARS